MIDLKTAFSMVMDNELALETESVTLADAAGRFLHAPVTSPMDSPPFDKSAMDGYALAAEDDGKEFEVVETVAAGEVPGSGLKPGKCIKIMTGAMLPRGAGKVVRVEYTVEEGGRMRIVTPEPYRNIIMKGENLKAGNLLIPVKRLSPGDIGSLAASGIPSVQVNRRLKVGIIATGSELREPGEPLAPGEIYNSNGIQLAAQIDSAGGIPVNYGIIPDTREHHTRAVERGLEECDILLLTGGVSKGDFDFVPDTLTDAGVEIVFHGIKVKPGRPTLFGRLSPDRGVRKGTGPGFVFGLPGNPVSTFMLFEVMVKPFMHHLNGVKSRPGIIQGHLASEIHRRDTERKEFRPVRITGQSAGTEGVEPMKHRMVEPVIYHGSAHLNALVETDGILVLEAGVDRLEKGALVDVRLI